MARLLESIVNFFRLITGGSRVIKLHAVRHEVKNRSVLTAEVVTVPPAEYECQNCGLCSTDPQFLQKVDDFLLCERCAQTHGLLECPNCAQKVPELRAGECKTCGLSGCIFCTTAVTNVPRGEISWWHIKPECLPQSDAHLGQQNSDMAVAVLCEIESEGLKVASSDDDLLPVPAYPFVPARFVAGAWESFCEAIGVSHEGVAFSDGRSQKDAFDFELEGESLKLEFRGRCAIDHARGVASKFFWDLLLHGQFAFTVRFQKEQGDLVRAFLDNFNGEWSGGVRLGRSRASYGVVEALRVTRVKPAEAIKWEAGPAQNLRTQRKVRLTRRLVQMYHLQGHEEFTQDVASTWSFGWQKPWWEFLTALYNQQPAVQRFFIQAAGADDKLPIGRWFPGPEKRRLGNKFGERLTKMFRSISQTEARAVVAELLTSARPNPMKSLEVAAGDFEGN